MRICAMGLWAVLGTGLAVGAAPRVLRVDLEGVVHPVTVEIAERAIAEAEAQGAELILVRINTPGGLMEAMRQTIEKLVASRVPVATWVGPSGGRAASAGFFLLEAGDVAAMAGGTNTGAAHPVLPGIEMDPVMKRKVENDAAAQIRALTARRGRNSQLAETAVRDSTSFTEREALDNRLIEIIAGDEADLLRQLDGREVTRFDGRKRTLHLTGAVVTPYELSARQKLMRALSDPTLALALLVLGGLGIYVEFTAPGMIAPGVIGAILALLGLGAISILPLNWMGVALILLAFALFALEAKFASHGVLGTGGALAMALGAVMLVDSPIPEMRIGWGPALVLTLPFSAITGMLVTLAMKARRNKVVTGPEAMVGETGVAISELAPMGKIFVHGEYWDARSPLHIAAGAAVRVTGREQFVLMVEPLNQGD